MPIFPEVPKVFYPCADGTYSTHDRRGACNWHGGLSDDSPVGLATGGASALGIVDVALEEIFEAPEWFQNRASAYSTRSVSNILDAVQAAQFRWANFDPITLWLGDDNRLYILSGHSRTEAFRQLRDMQLQAEGRSFDSIPAKIIDNITREEARQIALESNTLSTKETDLERATFYARMRAEGAAATEIKDTAKRLEGSNWTRIIAYSYLNPQGKTITALNALQSSTDTSNSIIQNVARWIGNARKNNPQLSNLHENELYDWLLTDKGYGTARNQVSSERDFKEQLQRFIIRHTEFGNFDPDKPLNIRNLQSKSPSEQAFDQQRAELDAEIRDLDRQIKAKVKNLASRGATETQIQELTAGLEATLRRRRIELQTLLTNRSNIIEQGRNEPSLFAQVNGPAQSNTQNLIFWGIVFYGLYKLAS